MRAIPDDPHLKKYWYNNQNVDEYCIKVDLIRGHENKKQVSIKMIFIQ